MTDEEINIKIAEACGWEDRGSFDHMFPENHLYRRQLNDGSGGYEYSSQKKFNYCNDLNAIAEAEKHLSEEQLEAMNTRIWDATMKTKYIWQVSARQRAMALIEAVDYCKEAK